MSRYIQGHAHTDGRIEQQKRKYSTDIRPLRYFHHHVVRLILPVLPLNYATSAVTVPWYMSERTSKLAEMELQVEHVTILNNDKINKIYTIRSML